MLDMFPEMVENIRDRIDFWWNSTTFSGASVEDIANHYRYGNSIHEKRAATYSLQLAVDALVEGEIDVEDYENIKDMAYSHVRDFYFDEDNDPDLILPETEKRTKQFLLHRNEDMMYDFLDRVEDHEDDPDKVIAVASGGLEPGMIAAEELDADFEAVRMSRWRKSDDRPYELLETSYESDEILVVEDKAGKTLNRVESYLENQGADKVEGMSVVGR